MGSAWIVGLALKPFAGLLIFGCIALPIRWAIHQWMPEGRIKTAILRHRLGKHRDAFMR